MDAALYLDTHAQVGPIDRRIFGGFLEHLGRAVYQGVFDPESPLSDSQGFRRDVIAVFARLGMPCVRYPGGNFVSAYDWKHGIGPKNVRPRRPDFAWQSIETNEFGTDEFMRWCGEIKAEPMLAVNLGTGSVSAAGELVEYCNMPGGTLWSDLRRQNGHVDSYGVELWCLGNEMDGPWQAGQVPAEVYAQRATQAAKLMKGLDAKIQTIACGSSGRDMPTYMHWDRTVLEYGWDVFDYISAHRYSRNSQGSAHFLAEGVEIDRILEDYRGLLAFVRGVKRSDKKVFVSFDEWNVWYRTTGMCGNWKVAPHLLEEVYNLEDALVCAQYLMSFVRHADLVKVACIAQIVNVIAPILTSREGLLIQSIFYPFEMISRLARGISLVPMIESPVYKAGSRGEVAVCDAAVSFDTESHNVAIFLVNRNPAADLTVQVEIADRIITDVAESQSLGGGDIQRCNTWECPAAVVPVDAECALADDHLRIKIPGPGFCSVQVATRVR